MHPSPRFRHWRHAAPLWAALAVSLPLLTALPALAQAVDGSFMLPSEIEVRGRGWSQIGNLDEVLDFALGLLEATVFTALLAFHPVNLRHRAQTGLDGLQKGLFLFALIGMLTGFLVLHHGYLIGFVIFGIGGLFRFRMEALSVGDTGQMVVASLVGLSVGLDLPVMGLIGAGATWLVLFVFGQSQTLGLEIKFEEGRSDPASLETVRTALTDAGFEIVSLTKAKFKTTVMFVLSSRRAAAQSELVNTMGQIQANPQSGVSDWHID